MLKSIKCLFTTAIIAVAFFFASQAQAQVPANTFGIDASFASEWDGAGVFYTPSNNFQVGLSLIFKNVTPTKDPGEAGDAMTTFGVDVYGAYYLSQGDVSPYLLLGVNYVGLPEEKSISGDKTTSSEFGVEFAFGAQAFIVKGLAVWGQIGINYQMESSTTTVNSNDFKEGTNTLQLMTSAVGASFYF